jgi:hypothetical protein
LLEKDFLGILYPQKLLIKAKGMNMTYRMIILLLSIPQLAFGGNLYGSIEKVVNTGGLTKVSQGQQTIPAKGLTLKLFQDTSAHNNGPSIKGNDTVSITDSLGFYIFRNRDRKGSKYKLVVWTESTPCTIGVYSYPQSTENNFIIEKNGRDSSKSSIPRFFLRRK